MRAPPLIFICHAGPDRPAAVRIHRALDRAGLRPWCAALDLVPGEKWDEVIPERLTQAAAVLVLVTDRWPIVGDVGVGWYGPDEVALAIDHARRIDPRMSVVPARLDGAGPERLPYGLRRLTEIEASAADPRPIVDGLTRALERRARALTSPEVPALNRRLAEAQQRLTALEAQGADRATIEDAISAKIAIKRSLRAGGQLVAGDQLDRYVLAERLGQGGFASVWRAWDPTRGAHVALKVLHGRWNRDASKVERFRRGVRQMARLEHPAVMPVLDVDREDNGWHFFVMPWMPGGDLYRAITRADDPLSADAGLRAVLAVADALAVAHRQGMVHRDVKPRNILLDADGRAKLADFDLVRALDTSGGTGTGAMGTFIYAAPEQLDRPQDVGPRTDVYALGMTAVCVLTGAQPETMMKWRPVAAVDALPATPAVRAWLLRAIALEAGQRPADAGAFAAGLRAALAPVDAVAVEAPETAAVPPEADVGGPSITRPPGGLLSSTGGWLVLVALLVLAAAWVLALIVADPDPGPAGATDAFAARSADAFVEKSHAGDICPNCGERRPATTFRPALVPIAPGVFTMGSHKGEAGRYHFETAHWVKLTRGFLIAETEVTQAQYAALMGQNPAYFQGTPADGERPVEQVSWLDVARYCNALSAAEGLTPAYVIEDEAVTWRREADGYRLPTEAEWEYAARAGTSTATYVGDLNIRGERDAPALDAIAWYGGNSGADHPRAVDSSRWDEKQYPHERAATHPVRGKQPNAWGLHDMLGNVWEWTWDWYADYPLIPDSAPLADPAGPVGGGYRVFRGGSFHSSARGARGAYRNRWDPKYQSHDVGFRPVRTLRAPPP